MPIPVNDLSRHWQATEPQVRPAIERVLGRGWFILGPEVDGFEAAFARYCGTDHCIGVANGTEAMELALLALGCGPGDEVATVANAGMYASTAIRAVGAMPRFVDVDLIHLTMSPAALERTLSGRVRAIVATHLYGRLANMPALIAVAETRGIPVIEDCAQSHGARRSGRMAGAWGSIGCFSFYPTKNLGAIGDGGAIVTSDAALACKLKALREYGWETKYRSTLARGRNSRLDELQAAVLAAKLPLLDTLNARRRDIASRYGTALADCGLGLPVLPDESDIAHLYVVRTGARKEMQRMLGERGIETDVHYPVPDHRQVALQNLECTAVSLPETERASEEILTLPCFPEITDGEIDAVIAAVCDVVSKLGKDSA